MIENEPGAKICSWHPKKDNKVYVYVKSLKDEKGEYIDKALAPHTHGICLFHYQAMTRDLEVLNETKVRVL